MAEREKTNFDKELHLSKVFPYPSYDDWKQEAEKLLKGAPFDKIMKTDTPEGITLKAIYNEEDTKDIPFVDGIPGVFPFVRGNTETERVINGWGIQQEIEAGTIKEWNAMILQSLKRGQNSFRLKGDEYSIEDAKSFFEIAFKDILLDNVSFDIEMCGSHIREFIKYCVDKNTNLQTLNGSFATDPLKHLVENGGLPYKMDELFDRVAEVTKKAIEAKTSLKTILIDLSVYNDSGSSAVDDLGIMASIVTLYADELQKRGIAVHDIFERMTFVLAVGSNMFMEIAKLRAARYLFAKLAEVYCAGVFMLSDDKDRLQVRNISPPTPPCKGGQNDVSPCKEGQNIGQMRLHVRTSKYTKTYYDPWVNILRTTTEAFSAIVGGCDSLHVTPFDCVQGQSDEFAKRIARNQQLILQEEAHLNAVNDPAGGSYYVEALTNELVQKGWELFLEIDDQGGFIKALDGIKFFSATDKEVADKGGFNEATLFSFLKTKINKSADYRLKNAETRKDCIVGTSVFANLSEKKLDRKKATPPYVPSHLRPSSTGHKSDIFSKRRLSETFEQLRMTIEKMDPRPEVFVANIGNAVKNKPRIDFAMGFFEPAGFICKTNDGFGNVQEAVEYIMSLRGTKQSSTKIIILSSTDDLYPTIVPEFAKTLKEKAPELILALAGYPKEHIEAFTQAGIDFFVYMRANVVQTVRDILKKIG